MVLKEIDLNDMPAADRRSAVKEADLLGMLKHDNIVSYFGSYLFGGKLLIEMEFCDGGSLEKFLSRLHSSLPEKEILGIFRQIMSALVYLDYMNILHRDLKTGNIFLTRNSTVVKLGDFGIAKLLSAQKPSASTILGTPFTFSPELCEGKRYSKKSDIWAAGCVLYEITCLQRTFDGPSLPQLINRIVKGTFAPIKGSYSHGLRHLISDLLQKNPDLRPFAADVIPIIDNLLIECTVDKSRRQRTQPIEPTETGFSCQVLDSLERKKPRRSLVFQVNFAPIVHLSSPLVFPPDHIIQLCKTKSEILLLTEEGTVMWGFNNKQIKPVGDLFGKHIVKVAMGVGFMLFLTDKGLLLASGDPKTSCLARYLDCGRNLEYIHSPEVVDSLLGVDIIDVTACTDHAIICSREGDVYSWGHNHSGCLGVGQESASPVLIPFPVKLPQGTKMARVFTGNNSSVFLDDKQYPWVCGSNSSRKLGLGSPDDVYTPHRLSSVCEPVSSVSPGDASTCLLMEDGSIIILGRSFREKPRRIRLCSFYPKIVLPSRVVSVCNGSQFFLALTQDNEVYFWGQRRKNCRISESTPFLRTKSVVTESLGKEDMIAGDSDESLIEIVARNGPDCPVILIKEPKVRIKDIKHVRKYRSDEEIILEPNLVMALYSSQINLKAGEFISFTDLVSFGDDQIFLVIETNCVKDGIPRTTTLNRPQDLPISSVVTNSVKLSPTTAYPSWVLREFNQPSMSPKMPVIPESRSISTISSKQNSNAVGVTKEEVSILRRHNLQLQEEVSRLRSQQLQRDTKRLKWSFLCCLNN